MRQAFIKIWKSRVVDESKALEKINQRYDEVVVAIGNRKKEQRKIEERLLLRQDLSDEVIRKRVVGVGVEFGEKVKRLRER